MNAMDFLIFLFPVFSVGKTSTVVNKNKKNKTNIIFVFIYPISISFFQKRKKVQRDWLHLSEERSMSNLLSLSQWRQILCSVH